MARSHLPVELLGGPDVPVASWLVPSGTLPPIVGVSLALALALVALLLLRRHRSARPQIDPDVVPESAEVRALRLHVRTLTETIDSLATRPVTTTVTPSVAPLAAPPARIDEPAPGTAPPLARDGYQHLSRLLARENRLPEAALAQWAADLRLLAPMLAGRGADLSSRLMDLQTRDPRACVAAARKLALSLAAADADVAAQLGSLAHLDATPTAAPPGRRTPQQESWRALLPLPHVAAFEATLTATAGAADDARAATVALRTALIAQRVEQSSTIGDPTLLVHTVLEPHERDDFGRRLELSAS